MWFNWRDLKHPDAGGAEVYTHEIMARLAKKGHKVTLFTSHIQNLPTNEEVDGINIIRRGSRFSIYRKAKEYYRAIKGNHDLVIDEINARPFLNPKIGNGIPILTVFHQLIKEEWFYETLFPFNYLCYYVLEKRWLLPYKNTPTITVSESSMRDLEALGFTEIFIVPNGLNVSPLPNLGQKESRPTVAFVGRLKKHKLPDQALEAFGIIKKEVPDSQMWMIGDGQMRESLEKNNPKNVVFFGRVSEEQKYNLLSRAHLILMPSVREGWGLIVTESNAMGTPVIGYKIPGLMDSILHHNTGILSESNSPEGIAIPAIRLLKDTEMLKRYSENALAHSRKFSWEVSADRFNEIIENVVQSRRTC